MTYLLKCDICGGIFELESRSSQDFQRTRSIKTWCPVGSHEFKPTAKQSTTIAGVFPGGPSDNYPKPA